MHIAISFPPGFTVEGVLVAASKRTLRVAVRGWDDIAVFHVRDGGWSAENGDPVGISPRALPVPGTRRAAPSHMDPAAVVGVVWDALPGSGMTLGN